MAKTKAKTVKVRVGVAFDEKGHYLVGGGWRIGERRIEDNTRAVIRDAKARDYCDEYPYTSVVEIELPLPKGKVRSVKAVKT